MTKLDKSKWLSSDTFEFKEDIDGKLIACKSEPGSAIKVIEESMPDDSFTKFLRNKLKDKI